jgi:signal transduction histidine kinase
MTSARELEHTLKNYLAIILGFSELLLQESTADDPRREDFQEIHKAAAAAVRVVSAIGAGDEA